MFAPFLCPVLYAMFYALLYSTLLYAPCSVLYVLICGLTNFHCRSSLLPPASRRPGGRGARPRARTGTWAAAARGRACAPAWTPPCTYRSWGRGRGRDMGRGRGRQPTARSKYVDPYAAHCPPCSTHTVLCCVCCVCCVVLCGM
jgi:hypothetical protein